MTNALFWLVPISSVLALLFAWYFYKQLMKTDEGTPQMKKIALYVRRGAMSYLRQQYKVVGLVFLVLVILFSIMAFGFGVQNKWVPVAFLTGGFFSGLSGYLGMKTATYASARTANAARTSLNRGLRIAFRSGAVMGLVVVGLGLLDISFWYLLLNAVIPAEAMNPAHKLCVITTTMLTFGMGASTQALFARVGGGIYTKAADVGADLVGKVEAGIPEDDPRNPATIADNVGDNVGDVAGMGADLYESYCGSILATSALGAVDCGSGYIAFYYRDIFGSYTGRCKDERFVEISLLRYKPQFCTYRIRYFWNFMGFKVRKLGIYRRFGNRGIVSGDCYRSQYGILYLSILSSDTAFVGEWENGPCNSHNFGYRIGYDFNCRSCDCRCRWYYPFLFVCIRVRFIECHSRFIWYRYCCGGNAFDIGNHVGNRCLWSYCR